ncbi:MAG: ABC transporter substrate-binding protein [Deinococcota bacterium]
MKKGFVLLVLAVLGFTYAQDTRTITDDFGVEIEVPVNPQRIVSLSDNGFTLPLLELGVIPVGTRGRGTPPDGLFIRGGELLLGVDFDNSDIQYVGDFPPDLELIAALEPDLIIGFDYEAIDQLRLIAPTYAIDFSLRDADDIYDILAELTGSQDQLVFLRRKYNEQLNRLRELVDVGNITISTIHADNDGTFFAFNPYPGIGDVLIDAGFNRPDAITALPQGQNNVISAERLQEFDGDFIITTYRYTQGVTPEQQMDFFEQAFPGYCDLLHACRNGQMYFVPRADFSSLSYAARVSQVVTLVSIIAGKPFVPFGE